MMVRPCVLWLEHFAIQCHLQEMPERKARPIALYDLQQRIRQANDEARTGGIQPGMRVRDATALLGDLTLLPLDDAGDHDRLAELGAGLFACTPRVARWGNEELVLDAASTAPLYGGEEGLLRALTERLAEAGFQLRAAVADSLAAARLAARLQARINAPTRLRGRAEQKFVLDLTPQQLAALPEFSGHDGGARLLGYLGLDSLRTLLSASRTALQPILRAGHDDLFSYARRERHLERHLVWLQHSETWREALAFTPPITRIDPLLHRLGDLFQRLQSTLSRQHLFLLRLDLHLTGDDARTEVVTIPLARPSRSPALLLELCRLRLDRTRLRRPLTDCVVLATEVAREGEERRELLSVQRRAGGCSLTELQSRIAIRLGRPAPLFQLQPVDAFWPEASWQPATEGPVAPPAAALPPGCDQPTRWLVRPVPWQGRETGGIPRFELAAFDEERMALRLCRYFRLPSPQRPFLLRREEDRCDVVGVDD